eukprot:6152827-Prymnesium_polylepis.1
MGTMKNAESISKSGARRAPAADPCRDASVQATALAARLFAPSLRDGKRPSPCAHHRPRAYCPAQACSSCGRWISSTGIGTPLLVWGAFEGARGASASMRARSARFARGACLRRCRSAQGLAGSACLIRWYWQLAAI